MSKIPNIQVLVLFGRVVHSVGRKGLLSVVRYYQPNKIACCSFLRCMMVLLFFVSVRIRVLLTIHIPCCLCLPPGKTRPP